MAAQQPPQAATADPEQMPLGRLLVLHLAPGALATLLYVVLAQPVQDAGFPPIFAFLIAIAVVIVPIELAVIIRASRREAPDGGWLAAIPFRRPLPLRDWAWLFPVLLVAAFIGFGVVALIEPTIRDSLFSWLPEWFRFPVPLDDLDAFSTSTWTITLIAYALMNVVIGPPVEELYFRGYLLPRMTAYGRAAPLLNVVLFSMYHFWTPWQILSRIAGVLPFAYAAWWKRNVYLGMAVHCTLNAIGTATVAALVFQAVG
jgi:hypothetical protein